MLVKDDSFKNKWLMRWKEKMFHKLKLHIIRIFALKLDKQIQKDLHKLKNLYVNTSWKNYKGFCFASKNK